MVSGACLAVRDLAWPELILWFPMVLSPSMPMRFMVLAVRTLIIREAHDVEDLYDFQDTTKALICISVAKKDG